ncbi:hypothetical protein MYX84_13375 [Acidobacteria bacterium AH-259-O06]|nr:hypothetical protein [Acidobacteria bacterium AH-259-O06]
MNQQEAPAWQDLENNTFIAFGDFDASPTKAWLVSHRNDAKWKKFYDYAFTKRPREELYILADDPDQVKNVADDAKYEKIRKKLNRQLMARLRKAKDPRVTGDGSTFDKPPYTNVFKRPAR